MRAFGWQTIAASGLGFVLGVFIANISGSSLEHSQPFQAKPGEVALFLRDADLYWAANPPGLGEQASLVKLSLPNNLTGSCRLNQKPVRIRLKGSVVGLALSTTDLGLARQLMYAMRKPRFKLGLLAQKESLKLKACLLRDAVTYVD